MIRKPQRSETGSVGRYFCLAALFFSVAASACVNATPEPDQSIEKSITLTVGVPIAAGADPLRGIQQTARLISFEGLSYLARDGRPQPKLAESWTESPDGLTWVIRLRQNAFYHDGTIVTAPTVKQSLERSIASSERDLSPGLADISQIDTPSDFELVVRLKQRSSFVLDNLTVAISKTASDGKQVGTGPFVVRSAAGEEVTMAAVSKYYRGRPKIDQVVIKAYPAVRTAWAAMMRGEIDFLYEVGPEAVDFVEGESSLTVFRFLRNYAYGVILNSARPEFAKPDVRRALNYAIDRQAIVRTALRDHGVAATGPAWPQHWAFDASVPSLTYDPVRATALLESAALPLTASTVDAPSRLRFTCLLPENFALWERMALLVQRNLAQIGVDMELQAVSVGEFNKRIAAGDFDAVLTDFIVGNSPTRPYFFWQSQSKLNTWRYRNLKVDEALEGIRLASDEAEYRAAFRMFQLETLESPPAIFLVLGETSRAVSNRFQVIAPSGTDILPTIADWQVGQTVDEDN